MTYSGRAIQQPILHTQFNITDYSQARIKSPWGTYHFSGLSAKCTQVFEHKKSHRQEAELIKTVLPNRFFICIMGTLSPSTICGGFHWGGAAQVIKPWLLINQTLC